MSPESQSLTWEGHRTHSQNVGSSPKPSMWVSLRLPGPWAWKDKGTRTSLSVKIQGGKQEGERTCLPWLCAKRRFCVCV